MPIKDIEILGWYPIHPVTGEWCDDADQVLEDKLEYDEKLITSIHYYFLRLKYMLDLSMEIETDLVFMYEKE